MCAYLYMCKCVFVSLWIHILKSFEETMWGCPFSFVTVLTWFMLFVCVYVKLLCICFLFLLNVFNKSISKIHTKLTQQQNQYLSGISDVFRAIPWLDLNNVSTCHSIVKHTSGDPICYLLACQWKWNLKKSFSLLWSSQLKWNNNMLRQSCIHESRMIWYTSFKDIF